MSETEVQTRGGEHDGELKFFKTLKEAFDEARKDETIWKISFNLGEEPVRLVKENGRWVYTDVMRHTDAKLKKKLGTSMLGLVAEGEGENEAYYRAKQEAE